MVTIKRQYKVNDNNKTDKKNIELPQLHNGKVSVIIYDVNKKQSHSSGKPKNDNIKINSNGDSKNNVKVITHPGSTTEDILDYIKPIARRKPGIFIIHTGTNDLINGVNTIKKVRKLRSVWPVLFTVKVKTLRMNEMMQMWN